MDERLQGAVEVLLEELAGQEKQVAETKKMINGLMRRMGQEPRFDEAALSDGPGFKIRTDAYYTKPLATAVQMFLQQRREPATAQEILRGLLQGGFEFKGWKEEDRLRLLASSIGKNTKTFHKVPNGAFGLAEWYDLKEEEEKPAKAPAATPAEEIPPVGGKTAAQGGKQ
jgi:hypothetical protein